MKTCHQFLLRIMLFSVLFAGGFIILQGQQLTFPKDFEAGDFKTALEKFRKTEEGKSEEKALANGEVTITIEMFESDTTYGDCTVMKSDKDGNPTEIRIRIDKSGPGDVNEIADTIKHELRHAEIFIENGDGEEKAHDDLHEGKDEKLNKFNEQLKKV